jgi:hypothetical protein
LSISWVTYPHEDASLAGAFQPAQQPLLPQLGASAMTLLRLVLPQRTHAQLAQLLASPTQGCLAALKAAGVKSVVQIGAQSGSYNANVTAADGAQRCYTVPSYSSGALHQVVVGLGEEGPLQSTKTYFYRVGDPDLGWSDEFNFTMPPEAHQNLGLPYRLGLIGDLGQTENSAQTLEHLMANKPDSVLNVGDLSYADGEEQRWDSYGRLVQPSTASVPHMTIEGNHELESIDGAPDSFLAYESRWRMPYERSGSKSALYYSYETGPAHILMLGSYAAYGHGSKQMAWLKRDLAAVDRSRTPWLVVGMHAPWYNSNTAHQGEVEDMRRSMEGLLFSYGVDLVFAGHVHAYERSVRVFNNRPHECGPVHIVIGDGGNREGLSRDYLDQPKWSAMREASYGHATLDFESATAATFRWHRNQDGAAVTADEVRLERATACDGHKPVVASASLPSQRRLLTRW